ncbi:hypothetical protein HWV62_45091 [Athelia sp. TMB]|nr:hypothetical protein HWV62_45091 [Athelia sp. TMB]
MSGPSKRPRMQSSDPIGTGLPRKLARLDDAGVISDLVADTSRIIRRHIIHAWMKAPDTSSSYNAARKKHQPGTGSWFLEGSQFSKWKKRPGSVLWLYGGPGCGKTILCSSVIDNVINLCKVKPSGRAYAYFLFDGTLASSESLNYERLIRSIIVQLSNRCGDIMPTALVDMYHTCDNGDRQPSESQLEKTLGSILESFDTIYLVIDSLDECVEKDDLLRWIQNMTSVASGKLHLMLSSRPEPDIEHGLAALSNLQKVQVGEQSTMGDISAYLDACFEAPSMNRWSKPGEKKIIKGTLLRGSDGMFRWVALQVHAVKKCKTEAELQKQLTSLPKDLDEAYDQIFQRSECPEYLQIVLQWLAFSKSPLTVTEIAEVMAVDFKGIRGPSYDPSRRYRKPADIWRVCNGLVTEFEGTMKLAHLSVREYVMKRIKPEAEAQSSTSEQFAHSIIAQTCLVQVVHFDGSSIINWDDACYQDLGHINSCFPLAQYSAMNWVSHFLSSGAAASKCPPLRQLLLQLFTLPSTTWSHALLSWIRIQNLIINPNYFDLRDKSNVLGRALQSFKYTPGLPLDTSPLYYACFSGSFQAVQHLIDHSADVRSVGCEASTAPLLIASEEGHFDIVVLLLDKGVNVNFAGGRYGTALQAACAEGHLEISTLLLNHGADVDVKGGEHGAALQAACAGGHLEISALLLANGADVNLEIYGTALQVACEGNHLEIVKLLLNNGAFVNVKGGHYGTALQAASVKGHLEIVRLLLANGAVADAGGTDGTALQIACAEGQFELAKLLLNNGADVGVKGGRYGTALQAASVGGHLEIARLLLDKGADVDVARGKYGTALQEAIVRGHLEIARLLLDKGADVDVARGKYGTALQEAIVRGHLEIARLLLDKGADVDVAGEKHGTALQAACERGHLELAKLLLDKNADVDEAGGTNGTALQAACERGHIDLTKLLLDNEADVNVARGYYGTALQAACAEGHLEIANLLLDKEADVNVNQGHFGTALQAACAKGHLEIARLLLNNGAYISFEGGRHGTALRAACKGGHLEIVKLLLDQRSYLDHDISYYREALEDACTGGHLEIAKMLLDKGADAHIARRYIQWLGWAASVNGDLVLAKRLQERMAFHS